MSRLFIRGSEDFGKNSRASNILLREIEKNRHQVHSSGLMGIITHDLWLGLDYTSTYNSHTKLLKRVRNLPLTRDIPNDDLFTAIKLVLGEPKAEIIMQVPLSLDRETFVRQMNFLSELVPCELIETLTLGIVLGDAVTFGGLGYMESGKYMDHLEILDTAMQNYINNS